jgi:hypoxanthine phosphoribosyltransferase
MPNKINVNFSWKEFDFAMDQIAWQLTAGDLLDKFGFIYGIPRGGLVIAVALSHRLSKPLIDSADLRATNTERVLVVDDISDTGNTLHHLAPILSATIHYNPKALFRPTAWVLTKEPDEWIVYPWEVTK